MTRIFISYKREEVAFARTVRAALRAEGFSVFWDEDVQGGQRWAAVLDEELVRCDVLVVLWSVASSTSDWVRHEAAVGQARGVLVSVLKEPCTVPAPLTSVQYVNLEGWKGDEKASEFVKLRESINATLGRHRSQRRRRSLTVAAAALAALSIGAVGARVLSPSCPTCTTPVTTPPATGTMPVNVLVDSAKDFSGSFCIRMSRNNLHCYREYTTEAQCRVSLTKLVGSSSNPAHKAWTCIPRPKSAFCYDFIRHDGATPRNCYVDHASCAAERTEMAVTPTIKSIDTGCTERGLGG